MGGVVRKVTRAVRKVASVVRAVNFLGKLNRPSGAVFGFRM